MSHRGNLLLKQKPFKPFGIRTVDLSEGVPDFVSVEGYERAFLVLKACGHVVDTLVVESPDGRVEASALIEALDAEGRRRLQKVLVRDRLLSKVIDERPALPSYSVIVCTRDRTQDLDNCLQSILNSTQGACEILVIDNDPPNDDTKDLAEHYSVKYFREMKRGLNWARTCGAKAATGDILIYTDDDVVVDAEWINNILRPFKAPRVAAVTGLTLPVELESHAQSFFEFYGGHGRGFERKFFDYTVIPACAAGLVGSGANMAIRRELVLKHKLFEQELDAGTRTLSGGDTYAYYQLLDAGHQIVYEPDALVWHRHRRDDASLVHMLYGYSVGGFALLMRCLFEHKDPEALMVGLQWFKQHHIKQLWRSLRHKPDAMPLSMILKEWLGAILSPWIYMHNRCLAAMRDKR